mmetsp:Transcript_8067/g.20628  ORF Transcript_8067/g.20628 Transcript_8067/m.20628 type:complete len:516 (-) Transcript_8067:124-1671(-)
MDNVRSVEDFEDENGVARTINSPRSLEACLRKGYAPHELLPPNPKKKLPSLTGSQKLPPELEQIKKDHMEGLRQVKIKTVKAERQRIIAYLSKVADAPLQTQRSQSLGVGPAANVSSSVVDRVNELQAAQTEAEYKRLEVIRRRQQSELQRMVEAEQKMIEVQNKIVAAEEYAVVLKVEHEKEKKKKEAALMEKKNKREMDLLDKQQRQLQMRKDLAEAEAKRDAELIEREKVKYKEIAQQMLESDNIRRAKAEERQAKMAAMTKAFEDEADRNRQMMLVREKRLSDVLNEKVRKKKAEVEQNRVRAAKRIADALDRQKQIQQEKYDKFEQKQENAKLRAAEKREEEMIQIQKTIKQQEEASKLRAQRLEDAKGTMEDRKQSIIENRKKRDEQAGLIHIQRAKEMQLKMLETDLLKEDKQQNVQRIRRVEEFNRLQTLQKIQEDDDRSERIKDEKAFVREQQKNSAHEGFIRKQRVKEAMNEMRVTNKFVNIESILGGDKKKTRGKEEEKDPASH